MLKDLLHAQLARPSSLWVLLPFAILAGTYAIVLVRRKEIRTALSLSLRVMALVFLAFAWADPIRKETQSSQQLIALLDTSASISKGAREALLSSLRGFAETGENLSISLFSFAKSVDRAPLVLRGDFDAQEILSEIDSSSLDRGETDIGAALQFASSVAPGSAVLLLSDGFETKGNAKESARSFASSGGRVYPLAPSEDYFQSRELELSMLQMPLTSKANDLVEVRTTARNTSSKVTTGKLDVLLDDKPILSQSITVPAQEEKLIVAKTPALEGGLKKVVARLTLASGEIQELHRWVSVRNKARLTLLSGAPEDERVLKQLLSLKGYSVNAITLDGSGQLPKNLDDCSGLILNNVSRDQLTDPFLNQVKEFANRGGGVLLVGGERSFGLGKYIDTPIEEISPLKFVPPKTAKRRLVKAVALVIDKSRSMASDGKIEGARNAALLSIESLKDEDYATVIGFDATAFTVLKLDKVEQLRPRAFERLANLVAMGKTNPLPALAEARRVLSKAPADRKHIIVLSDGRVDYQGDEYLQEISRMRQEGITLSGVALGEDADAPFMQILAQYGRGVFYQTLSSTKLPEIFINDIKVATGEKTMKERQDFPVGIGPAGVRSTSLDRYPALRGFVETLPKRGAEIELITKSEESVSPLLASWRYGSGTVIAFTSDANGRWSLPWLSWEGFSRFWTDLIEKVEHAPDENSSQVDFDLRTSVNRGALALDLSVFDEKLQSGAAPKITAEVTFPGGEKRTASFLPERRGRFKGVVENIRPGDYRVQIFYGTQKFPVIGVALDGGLFGEAPGRGLNRANLSELAALTGGLINPKPNQVSRSTRMSENTTHLFPPLIIPAFVLLILEVFLRELGFGAIRSRLRTVISAQERGKPSKGTVVKLRL